MTLACRFKADGPTGGTGFRVNFVQLVTLEGEEIPGETELCRAERAPLPPVPEAVVRIGPDGSQGRQPDDPQDPRGTAPTDRRPDGGFFRAKPEDSC